MNPTNPELLRESAMPDCYSCKSTGRIVGFGFHGHVCPCVVHCAFCDSPIPQAQYKSEEDGPRKVDGMPACDVCREQMTPMERAS